MQTEPRAAPTYWSGSCGACKVQYISGFTATGPGGPGYTKHTRMKYLLLFLFLLPALTQAQDDDYYRKNPNRQQPKREYTVLLKDGTSLRGEVVRQDSVEAVVRTRNLGEVRVPADQIIKIELRPEIIDGPPVSAEQQPPADTYINQFPQTMRLASTALQAEKRKLYFRNYVLYISQFEYGISDNWSVSASFFTLRPSAAFSVSTKFSLPVSNRVRVGASVQYAGVQSGGILSGGNQLFEGITYVQGLVTTGDRQNNVTYGAGWTISNGEVSRNFVATFGLVRKVSPKLSFITENFALLGSGVNRSVDFAGLLSAGIRFDRRRHAFDLAAYVPLVFARNDAVGFTLIPFGSYHLRISK